MNVKDDLVEYLIILKSKQEVETVLRCTDQLEHERDLALAHVNRLAEIVIWMSGSSEFGEDGIAGHGWKTWARPHLMAALDHVHEQQDGGIGD